jgi:hypothetical protein
MEHMDITGVAACRTRAEKMPHRRSVRLFETFETFETRWYGWATRASLPAKPLPTGASPNGDESLGAGVSRGGIGNVPNWRPTAGPSRRSQHAPWLAHDKPDVIVKSGALKDRAVVLDLKDHEPALAWIDGRFSHLGTAPLPTVQRPGDAAAR